NFFSPRGATVSSPVRKAGRDELHHVFHHFAKICAVLCEASRFCGLRQNQEWPFNKIPRFSYF
ncbi:MAG: hypothetical protein ACPGWR_29080, partial [Ardenticatenaceae bacterium]